MNQPGLLPFWLRWIVSLVVGPFRAIGELFGLARLATEYGSGADSATRIAQLKTRRMAFLLGLPAFLLLTTSTALSVWNRGVKSQVINLYTERFSALLNANTSSGLESTIDRVSTNLLALRVFHDGFRASPDVALNYCKWLAQDKKLVKANSLMAQLAPNNSPGYPPAHAQRAIAFSNLLTAGVSSNYLPTLLWHLQQAGEPDSESIWLAWANYYRLEGKIDGSVGALESAAAFNPSHWFSVADLYLLDQKPDLARKAISNAINAFRLELARDPLSTNARIQLALAHARGGEVQLASDTLQTGLDLSPENQALLEARVQLDVAFIEQRYLQSKSVAEKLDCLRELRDKVPDATNVYQRTVEVYRLAQSTDLSDSVKSFLAESLTVKGPNPALYFSKSVIAIIDERFDDARAELEQAIDKFPGHGLSLNNLAWLLATKEPKDIARAKNLAQRAIETNSDIPTYRDTLGAILLESNEVPQAIEQLESALARTPATERYKLHEKLSKAYGLIGNDQLAKLHQEKSKLR